ncbi:hypothetical protein LBW62_12665, partial [Ralstonia solanacearum]|uniref:hypothetical protein n=2 Tax=Ralstonia solanacearum TaxID=305 RepID=UPI001CF5EEE4|nr:hypothetical protein [Ralstonia solanacearum]MDB0542108.1 hypothetical protein [Ralstonia solanacearum]MDB0552145.1 hypothetical protein [Ralstonia solanacearum]MDB0557044.1 hypothetical protein [Ralstonia solanacearum]
MLMVCWLTEVDEVINFCADIVSGKSIGGIVLGGNVSEYLEEMYSGYHVAVKEYHLPDGEARFAYCLDETLTVVTLPAGSIFSIGCNGKYRGRYNGCIYPGQTMRDVIGVTERQRIFNGCLVINDDFGLSFVLPSPYDEIADSIGDIPLDLVLEEIYVSDFSAWNPNRRT